MQRVGRLLLAGAAACVGLLFWNSALLSPLKLLVVVIHEAGHALAARAVGGQVLGIEVDKLEGGMCLFRIEPTFWNEVVTPSGYLGSALVGAVLLFVTLRRRSGRLVLAILSLLLLLVCVLWAHSSLFTFGLTLGMSLALGLAARFLPKAGTEGLALFVAVFAGLYALFDLKDDLWAGAARRSQSDAAILAHATGVPALLWAVLWTLVGLGLIGLALYWGARGGREPEPAAGLPGEDDATSDLPS